MAAKETATFDGQLEINYNAGVVYFHSEVGRTLLRISGLPKPIEERVGDGHTDSVPQDMLDITFINGRVNWSRPDPNEWR